MWNVDELNSAQAYQDRLNELDLIAGVTIYEYIHVGGIYTVVYFDAT